ncbi:MAG: hypothetical protein AAF654_13600 [Myxococcota bacterium]
MSEIKTTPNSIAANLEAQQAQAKAEQEAIAVQVATRSRSVVAVGATKEAETAAAILATSTAVPEPSVPTVSMDAEAVAGAQSFAGNLYHVGGATSDSNLLLSRFLKLQVLTETNDKWSQVFARQAQSLLMLGALEMSKNSTLDAANAAFAKASQYQSQALAMASAFLLDGGGGGEGGGGRSMMASMLHAPQVTYSGDSFNVADNANPNLVAAIEAYSEAERLSQTEQPGADEAYAAAEASLDAYTKDPSKFGDVVQVDGKLYDIGSMPKGTIMAVLGALAKADYYNQKGANLQAAHAQGVGASQMRKGQALVDSMKRLEGHDQHLNAVMKMMSGTESKDEKLKALSVLEEQRQSVAALVEQGASHAGDYQRNRVQPLNA